MLTAGQVQRHSEAAGQSSRQHGLYCISPTSACCVLSFAAANSDGLPLPAAAAHHGWLARQYQQAAEMITGSRMDAATLQVRQHLAEGWSLDIDLAAPGFFGGHTRTDLLAVHGSGGAPPGACRTMHTINYYLCPLVFT
jgi:hypothetical protein